MNNSFSNHRIIKIKLEKIVKDREIHLQIKIVVLENILAISRTLPIIELFCSICKKSRLKDTFKLYLIMLSAKYYFQNKN